MGQGGSGKGFKPGDQNSGGTVTAVTGTAPIASTGGTTPDISIAPATALADGSLSATDKALLDELRADLASGYLLVTSTFTTGATQPGQVADALMAGEVAGGRAGPGQGGTAGIVAGSFGSLADETGTGAAEGGLGSAAAADQPYDAADFPGGRFPGYILKPNGTPAVLLDMLSTAAAGFPSSVAAPVLVFWSYRSDLGANLKWRPWFYFRRQTTGLLTPFTPDTSLVNTALYAPKVALAKDTETAAGLGDPLQLSGPAVVEYALAGDIANIGTAAAAGASSKVLRADAVLPLTYAVIKSLVDAQALVPYGIGFRWANSTVGNSTGNIFLSMLPGTAAVNNEIRGQWVVPCAGKIGLLRFALGTALAAANLTITIRKNGVNTAITCTCDAGAIVGSDATHEVAVAAGDLISCLIVASATDATTSQPTATLGFKPTY